MIQRPPDCRFALPHATVHMHPAGGVAKGYTEDVRIAYHEQERLEKQIFHIVVQMLRARLAEDRSGFGCGISS